jgi:hypothetical protein
MSGTDTHTYLTTASDILLQRAEDFCVERAASNYLAVLDAAVERAADRQ